MSQAQRVWRFQLDQDYSRYVPELAQVQFQNSWLGITAGALCIRADYAWDGCSPTWFLPLFGWVGIPNGPLTAQGVPQSYYATLVHDALCQFRGALPIDKAVAVALLKQMLIEGGFPRWRASLYANAVRLLGPQNWRGSQPQVA